MMHGKKGYDALLQPCFHLHHRHKTVVVHEPFLTIFHGRSTSLQESKLVASYDTKQEIGLGLGLTQIYKNLNIIYNHKLVPTVEAAATWMSSSRWSATNQL